MKRLIIYSFILLGLLVASCNESLETDNQLAYEVANTDLYLDLYGFQTANTVSQVYDEFVYSLELNYKGTESLTANLVVDETILSEYNKLYETDYQVLSADYYSLDETVTVSGSSTSIPVTLNTKKIYEELGIDAISDYVIPIAIEANNDTITLNKTMCEALLHVTMEEPTVTMETTYPEAVFDDTTGVVSIAIKGHCNFDGLDVSTLSVTMAGDEVATYNSKSGTDYLVLPATLSAKTLDTESNDLTINFELNTKELEKTTYVLPINVSSDAYQVEPGTTIYYVVTINNTVPDFMGIFDYATIQPVTNDYSATQVKIDLSEAASLLGTTEDELSNNLVLYAVQPDGTFATGYTANAPGFWMNDEGYACGWGESGCMLYAELQNDGTFNIGQFPDAATAGAAYDVSFALVYNGQMVRYNITLNVLVASYDISVSEPVDNDYIATQMLFSIDDAAADFGVSTSELKNNCYWLAQNSDGEVISGYTANNGFWMNNEGNVCGWGEEGCAIYIEYDANTSFNVGQFPGGTTSGDVYDYTLIMVYEGKYIKYNVTVTIE